jgi:mevalonate kinase
LKNEITVSAPGKLMLFGEHAVIYGKPCIVTAVDQRIRVTAEKLASGELTIYAPDVGITGYRKSIDELGVGDIPREVKFIEFAVKNFKKTYGLPGGVKINTKSDFSSKFGFGSSSSVTAAVLKALSELIQKNLSKKELFDLSYKTVIDIQGVGSGFDLAAAIWGGTLYFVGGGKVIESLKTTGLPLVVGYTGVKADTATLIRRVGELYKFQKTQMGRIFDSIRQIVEEAKIAIEDSNFKKLGELMNVNQKLLESLGVSTQKLSDLISASRDAGAYGAKLSGAGGGDCMFAISGESKKNAVGEAIKKAGGQVIDIKTNAEGVKIEKVFT